jgi:predicted nuclease of predicted toxin-antitoxin system
VRFPVDAQLPPALTRWLGEQGHVAEHVFDLGMAAADDRVIWDYAAANGAVNITKDEDFALRRAHEAAGPRVVWVRRGNVSTRELLRWFEPALPRVRDALAMGELLVEVV